MVCCLANRMIIEIFALFISLQINFSLLNNKIRNDWLVVGWIKRDRLVMFLDLKVILKAFWTTEPANFDERISKGKWNTVEWFDI